MSQMPSTTGLDDGPGLAAGPVSTPAPASVVNRRLLVLIAIGLAVLLGAAYSNHFANPFTFDDTHTITDNVYIRDIRNVPLFFTDIKYFGTRPDNRSYRPMLVTLNAIDYWIAHGLNERVFHADIFLSYVLLLVLLYGVFRTIFKQVDPAANHDLLALLLVGFYGLHTANAETINYIIMRSDSFSTLCMVASLALYQSPALRRWHLYLVTMLLGILTKETGVMFAPILFCYVLLIEERVSLRDLVTFKNPRAIARSLGKSAPALALAIGFFVFMRVWFMRGVDLMEGGESRWGYFYTQWLVIVHYLGNFILPLDLSADPDFDILPSVMNQQVLLSLGLLLALVAVAFVASAKRRGAPIAFGILWYFVSLAPTSSVIPFGQIANEHRTFLPNIGLVLAVGWAGWLGYERWRANVRNPVVLERGVAAALVCVLLLHAYGTYRRNIVWSSDALLWADAAKKSPNNGRALMNYGLTLMSKGDYQGTLPYFKRTLELMPAWAYIHINMGILRNAMGFPEEAEQYFRNAIHYQPLVPEGYYYYARWLDEKNRTSEALQQVDAGLAVSPGHTRLQSMREALAAKVQPEKSIAELERTAAEHPTADAFVDLSLAYYRAGRSQECIEACKRAIALKPDFAQAWNNMCCAYNALGQWDQAVNACNRALAIAPDFQLAKNNLKWATDEKAKNAGAAR